MVIAIISITCTAAVYMAVDYMPTYRLRSAAWQLMAHLRTAQLRASNTSVEYRVNFNIANQSYQIERGNRFSGSNLWVPEDPDNPTRLGPPNLTLPNNITFSMQPAGPVVFRTNGTNRDDNKIDITLKNEKDKTHLVSISQTGRVKVD